jgi:transcriptional regulator with XRE-family HTH domain
VSNGSACGCRPGGHRDTPALPFCGLRLSAEKPLPKAYPCPLCTIGDHIRKRRLDLGLLQKEAAKQLGVSKATIMNWERNHRAPAFWNVPAVIRFLGYAPFPLGESLPERLRAYRKIHGLSRTRLARVLGVDESTLRSSPGSSDPCPQSR